jgi:hypothetical protein
MPVDPRGVESERRQMIAIDTMHAVMYTKAQIELDHIRCSLLEGAAIKMRDREKVGGRLDATAALIESMRDIIAVYDNPPAQNGKAG